jgi:mono/diheme cytochrome c family protein
MTRGGRLVCGLVLLVAGAAAAAVALIVVRGVGARDEPTFVEAFVARRMRRLAIPRALRARVNPVPATAEVLSGARAHFADHCASCHGNDGKGETIMGRNMYPKAPDMTLPETQQLSDGELFAIIENGVRLTGMPAWGSSGPEDDAETWQLVHFIRQLPELTPGELDEMKELNPKTKKELEEEEAISRFLAGEAPPPEAGSHAH